MGWWTVSVPWGLPRVLVQDCASCPESPRPQTSERCHLSCFPQQGRLEMAAMGSKNERGCGNVDAACDKVASHTADTCSAPAPSSPPISTQPCRRAVWRLHALHTSGHHPLGRNGTPAVLRLQRPIFQPFNPRNPWILSCECCPGGRAKVL